MLFIGFNVLFIGALLSKQSIRRARLSRAFTKLCLTSSILLLLALLMPGPVGAVLIVERSLSTDPLRGPFGIDVAVNGSFVVFAEKHAGKIGFMGTGIRLLGSPPIFNETYSEFALPGPDGATAEPRDVELGNFSLRQGIGVFGDAERFVWFTEFVRNRIGVLNLTDGRITEWTIPTSNSGPWNLAIDPYNGSIWFTEYQANKIGRLFWADGTPYDLGAWRFVEYTLPFPDSYPTDIAVDPEFWYALDPISGQMGVQTYVFFTEQARNRIGRLNSETGEIVEYETRGTPWGITITPESFVWFTQKLGDRLARLDHWVPLIEEVPLPVHSPGNEPLYLKNDSDRAIWFTESVENRIGKYIPGTNVFQEYIVPTSSSKPHGIAVTPRLWGPGLKTGYQGKTAVFFTEEVGNKIGMLIQPYGPSTTTTVGFISSASTSTTSPTTVTTTASSTSTSKPSTSFTIALRFPTTYTTTLTNYTTTITDTISILVTSTTSTWTKTGTSTSVTTATTTSTSTSTKTSTTQTTTTTTSTSSMTLSGHATTTTSTTTTYTSTSYSPTITTATTVAVSSTVVSTTTTTTTTTQRLTTVSSSTTSITTTTVVTVTPARACVIASAAFGSGLAPEVQCLRAFRDSAVGLSLAGSRFLSVFNAFYYSFSPAVAEVVSSQPALASLVRLLIYPLVGCLSSASAVSALLPAGAEVSIVLAGLVASGLIGLTYGLPVLLVLQFVRRRMR